MMPVLPTGTVTFLFSDIEGSTRLLQRLGPAYPNVLGEHQALLRAVWAEYGGYEISTEGDSFFVAFGSAPQAVAAAAEVTRALATHAWPEGVAVRVRIGLHTGAPQMMGSTYAGLDVHRAARIAAVGHGGQILLSETTRVLAERSLPRGASLRDLGAHRLKDLQYPEHLYQLVLTGLPADFPPLKVLDAHPHNLPIQPTPLLGRDAQVAVLVGLLRREDVRLVTLTGPGGIGKTRLALQVAAEVIDTFPDGVWFVRLSRLFDPTLVVPTIAQTLGLQEQGTQSLADLLRSYLRDRHLLLVLDNFEQVVGAASEMATLLEESAGLKLLVTSRLPLRLRVEREYPVVPLPLPDTRHLPSPDRLSQYAAVALFVERARAARPTFAVTAANAPAIAEICARLDGLPLAIELAAARVRLLPPEALLARLSTRQDLLAGGSRDLEERQQTIRATIAWSEDLLTLEEQRLFRRLAIFAGGCTLDAAEAVCVAPEGVEPLQLDLFEGLSTLVDHSLIEQREDGGEPRFGMLHTIREYALERLRTSGESEALRRAHAREVLALVERAEPELTGPEAAMWLDRLEREHDNIRSTLTWARDREEIELALRLVAAAARFWARRGHLNEGQAWFETFLALASEDTHRDALPVRVRARALVMGGLDATWHGDYALARAWAEEGAPLARAAGDLQTAGYAANLLGFISDIEEDHEQSVVYYAEFVALSRQIGDRRGMGTGLLNLSEIAAFQGDLDTAETYINEAQMLLREVGDEAGVASTLSDQGSYALERGDLARAASSLREALALSWKVEERRLCALILEQLGCNMVAEGQMERAARLIGTAASVREEIGAPPLPMEQPFLPRWTDKAKAALGEERWAAEVAGGRARSLEEVIAEILGSQAVATQRGGQPSPLSE